MALGQLGNSVGSAVGAIIRAYRGDFSGLVEIASNKAEGGKFKKLGDPLAGVGPGGGVASQVPPANRERLVGVGATARLQREEEEANDALVEYLVELAVQ